MQVAHFWTALASLRQSTGSFVIIANGNLVSSLSYHKLQEATTPFHQQLYLPQSSNLRLKDNCGHVAGHSKGWILQ